MHFILSFYIFFRSSYNLLNSFTCMYNDQLKQSLLFGPNQNVPWNHTILLTFKQCLFFVICKDGKKSRKDLCGIDSNFCKVNRVVCFRCLPQVRILGCWFVFMLCAMFRAINLFANIKVSDMSLRMYTFTIKHCQFKLHEILSVFVVCF